MLATASPFPQYFDTDGKPLTGGAIYFGVANQNPETNPITVYWDAAGTQPAAQPIETLNGYTVRNGTPAVVYATGDYSITVRNKRNASVFYAASALSFSSLAQAQAYTDTLRSDISGSTSTSGSYLVGHKDTLSVAVDRTLRAKALESVSLLDFGAVGDGSIGALSGTGTGTNDYTVIQAGLDAITARGKPTRVIVPFGYVFRMDSKLKVNATFVTLDFQGGAFDFFNVTGTGIQVYATGANPYSAQPWAIGHGKICGPNFSVAGSVGVLYESNSGGVGTTDIQQTFAQGITFWGFETSIKIGNNAYLNNHIECKFFFSKYWLTIPSGLTNAGQRWTFAHCSLLNGINGMRSDEPTFHADLISCTAVPTGGYMFRPEAGFFTMHGGGVEVDASTGSQMIYNNNVGAGAKCGADILGAEVLLKNHISKSPIEINSTNCNVRVTGKKWSVADAVAPGTVPLITGTGSGSVLLDTLFDHTVTATSPATTAGASIIITHRNPTNGVLISGAPATHAGVTSTAGMVSAVSPGGSVFALSGNSANQVVINATPTVIVADNSKTFFWLVRDNTAGGAAFGIYDQNGGLVVLSNTIAATVAFTTTAAGLKAATTAGTATRTLIVLAIRA